MILKFLIPSLVGFIIFANHYCRDTVGTLEKQLEQESNLTVKDYSTFNSIYFIPNIIAPLFIGYLIQKLKGPSKLLILCVTIATIGHGVFALGAQLMSKYLLFFGRFAAGLVYEIIDSVPIVILSYIYVSNWGTMTGLLNGFLRMGSVFTFFMSPFLYHRYNVITALWFAASMSALGIFASIGIVICLSIHYKSSEDKISESTETTFKVCDIEKDCKVTNENVKTSISRDNAFDDNKVGKDNSSFFEKYLPLRSYSMEFYYYLLCGTCLYGSMVPFWFMGSKFIQKQFSKDLVEADMLMQLPEGCIVIISPLLGLILDCQKDLFTLNRRLLMLALSCFGLAGSYLLLITPSIDPVMVMVLMGVCYAFSNSLFWNNIVGVINSSELMPSATGLVASCLNILPSIVPYVNAYFGDRIGLTVLSLLAAMAGIFGVISSCHSTSRSEGSSPTDLAGDDGEVEMTSNVITSRYKSLKTRDFD